jgi:CDP-glycerol glycerophosphotransferase (TagB/SpsB family)
MKIIIVFIINIFNYFIPKVKNQIIFYSFSDFSDNARAVYEEMHKLNLLKQYKTIWAVKKPDNYSNAFGKTIFVSHKSFKCVWYFVRSKYIIRTHSFMGGKYIKKRQVMILLPHGMPLKGLGTADIRIPKNSYDFSSVTSDFYRIVFALYSNADLNRNFIAGLPRNDDLFHSENVLSKIGINKKYAKIIIWMPTFRISFTGYSDGKSSETGLPVIERAQLNLLNDFLKCNNLLLIVKLHPWAIVPDLDYNSYSNMFSLRNEMIPFDTSLYNIIGATDLLLTDYSSIYIDYLLLNRPIGFVFNDLDEYYKTRERFFDDIRDYMAGEHISSFEGLIGFLSDFNSGIDKYVTERQRIIKLFHKYVDDKSSERVVKQIFNL